MPEGADTTRNRSRAADRYRRHEILPFVGAEGQAALLRGCAAVIGCGALGAAVCDILTRAGVGTITIIDRDVVELSNLHRQVLFDEADARAGAPKALAAGQRLREINAGVRVMPHALHLDHTNIERVLGFGAGGTDRPGVLIDGTDNFATRFLLNDLSVREGVPYVYGGVVGAAGMAAVFVPGRTACLRCVFPEPPAPGSTPTCESAGVFSPAAHMIAAREASLALGVLMGRTVPAGVLLEIDAWSGWWRQTDLGGAAADCPCCAGKRFEFLEGRGASDAMVLCGSGAVQIAPSPASAGVDLQTLTRRIGAGRVRAMPGLVRVDAGEGVEVSVFGDGRALVRGAGSVERARAAYDRVVGA